MLLAYIDQHRVIYSLSRDCLYVSVVRRVSEIFLCDLSFLNLTK